MEGFSEVLEAVREFLSRDDLEVSYREEEEYGFKRSEAPSCVARIREVKSPDGRVMRLSVVETHYDDAGVSFQETVIELWQNWMEPARIHAYMVTGEDGRPVFSDERLFWDLNGLWSVLERY